MQQILINIDCDGELCGNCAHRGTESKFYCKLFQTLLNQNAIYQPKRCDACLRAELLVNEKLYSVKDFIVYKLNEPAD